jgi:hypothetical protein
MGAAHRIARIAAQLAPADALTWPSRGRQPGTALCCTVGDVRSGSGREQPGRRSLCFAACACAAAVVVLDLSAHGIGNWGKSVLSLQQDEVAGSCKVDMERLFQNDECLVADSESSLQSRQQNWSPKRTSSRDVLPRGV